MNIIVENWTIRDLINKKDEINPRPQYQRTSVWNKQKKMLLIDSILRGYDLPKFYLRETPNDSIYKFEVTDGQQRMRSLWEFICDGSFSLGTIKVGSVDLLGKKYEDLEKEYPEITENLNNYTLNVAVIKESTPEEIRTLFARLQMGERLNPVELRHAIASNLGVLVQSLIENHSFFDDDCKINNGRFKHQDYIDHVLALVYYNCEKNIKAPEMRALYLELADVLLPDVQSIFLKINKVLSQMKRINSFKKGIFKNKWAFVDTFFLLYSNLEKFDDIKPKLFCESFVDFENTRKKNNQLPEKLIEDKTSMSYNKDMYDYIVAFKIGGAEKGNVKIRNRVFTKYFLNNTNFVNLKL